MQLRFLPIIADSPSATRVARILHAIVAPETRIVPTKITTGASKVAGFKATAFNCLRFFSRYGQRRREREPETDSVRLARSIAGRSAGGKVGDSGIRRIVKSPTSSTT